MEGKLDLRVIKTQRALCCAFEELLGEKRFDAITVQELCERAMVRRATFYKHFYDKYDFWGFFIRQKREEFLQTDAKGTGDIPWEQYNLYLFRQCIAFFRSEPTLVRGVIKSDDAGVLMQILSEEIYAGILQKLRQEPARCSVSAEVLATFCAGGIVEILRRWVLSANEKQREELSREYEQLMKEVRL